MSDDLVTKLLDGIVAPEGAFNEDPPIWAQDPFNGDTAEKCGRCRAWCSVVRPGKTQCDYCCDSDDYALRIEAATALTEARAEIERLRSTTVGDWASQRENDALTIEKYQWKERALAAESELSTLRARVREVVGPFAEQADGARLCGAELDNNWRPFLHRSYTDVDITNGHLRAARQLMEDLKDA